MTSKTTSLIINSNDKLYSTDTHDNFSVDVNLGSFVEPDDERYFVRVDAMSSVLVEWSASVTGSDLLLAIPHSVAVLCPSMPQYYSYDTNTGTESQCLTILSHEESDSYHPPAFSPGNDGTPEVVTARECWKKTYEVDPFMLRREVVQNKRFRLQLKFINDPAGTLLSSSGNFKVLDGDASPPQNPIAPPALVVAVQPWQMRLTISK